MRSVHGRSVIGVCAAVRAAVRAAMRAAKLGPCVTCAALAWSLVATPQVRAELLTAGEAWQPHAGLVQAAPVSTPNQSAPPTPTAPPKPTGAPAKPVAPRQATEPASTVTAATVGERVATEKDAPTTGVGVLSRLVVLGASASSGISLPGGLADAMGASIAAEHEAPLDVSSVLFFMMNDSSRKSLVKKAAEHRPSALIGIDFLFWYGYGDVAEEERVPLLEQGLAILDGFACPIVISEFPDMSPAVGLMLHASQVPTQKTLVALNARLKAWAAERPRVIVVPLVETIAQMRAGTEITIGALKLPACAESRYLQADKLHPTAEGLAVMACLVNEGLRTHVTGLKATDFVSEPAAVLNGYTVATKDRKPRGLF